MLAETLGIALVHIKPFPILPAGWVGWVGVEADFEGILMPQLRARGT